MRARIGRLVRRLPLACWLVVLVAALHGAAWAVLTPAFQGPDEIAHFAYAEYVAKTGKPPSKASSFSVPDADTVAAIEALPWSVDGKPSWSPDADRDLERRLDRLDRDGVAASELGAAYQATNPPLYQYLVAIPYRLADALGGTTLDRLLAVRLATVAIGTVGVLFVVLLLRELFPRRRWAWVAGGLAVALQPVLGFLIGTVNNDVPVLTAGAALLWLLTRAFRRGLTWPTAVGLGGAVLAGLLSKVSAYGLLAVLGWGLAVLALQQWRSWRAVLPRAVVAVLVAVVPLLLLQALRDVHNVDVTGGIGTAHADHPVTQGPRDFVSYLWQFWLPQLPFMDEQFPGYPHYPLWETYVQAFAGRFGWFSFGFSPEASRTMIAVLVGLGAAAAAGLARHRDALRRDALLLLTLVGAFVGYALMVNLRGWQYRQETGENFEQVRYLFPMIGLYGALVAAALLAFPPRWHRPLTAVVAVAAALHVLASWGVVLTRYYM